MARHTDTFAARLRDLKDRSNRSYGALAQRLHTSTSTLHRYCNGTTVPAEFAPAERFARACGATPEEVLALHRLWLLADAERRAETAAVRAGEVAGSGAEGTAESGSATGSAADNGEAAVDPAGGASTLSGASTPSGAAAGSGTDEPTASSSPATELAAGSSATEPPASSPAPEPPAGSSATEPPAGSFATEPPIGSPVVIGPGGVTEPDRSTSRRLKPTLAGLAAAAVLVPLALYATHDSGTSTRSAGSTPASTPATTSAATTSAATTSAAAPSAASPTPPPSSPSSPSPSLSPSPSASLPTPVTVNVLADNWDTECGQWFYASQPPSKVPPPPGLPDVGLWAQPLGAVPGHRLRLQLTAQGTAGRPPVVLHTLYVHIVGARPAPKGGYGYTMGSGCGGGLDPASFAIELDASAPKIKAVAGQTSGGDVGVADFPFQVSGSDSQVLDVDAHATNQEIDWTLVLVWSCGDQQGKLTVDDHGKPFRTIGLDGKPVYFYDGSKWSPTTLDQ